jgi:hypothetical protein
MSSTMPSQQDPEALEEASHTISMQTEHIASSTDLVTPEEAARIMSKQAGYEITPDDIKQMRRRNKLKAAKQMRRMTLYERSEIEAAIPPKKRHPKKLEPI